MWGLCRNFNLKPAEKLLRTENVAGDFIFKLSHDASRTIVDEEMPWNFSNVEDFLMVRMFMNGYDDSNVFQPHQGFRVFLHSPNEFPSWTTSSFYLPLDFFTEVKIKPQMTLVDDNLRSVSFKKRNCYFEQERVLKYFKVYTKNNCEQECLSLMIADNCGCVTFHLVREFILFSFILK